MQLPHGVRLTRFKMNCDERGSLTEVFRTDWNVGVTPRQWNVTVSQPNVLRGVHVHYRHTDYLVVLQGRMSIGLHDVRPKSPTFRMSCLIELSGDQLSSLLLPAGVLHGFYCSESTTYLYGFDSHYDPEDELGCHWADAGLGIAWPCRAPALSARDRNAGSLAALEARLRAVSADFA